eukprot:gene4961-9927_t
MLFCSFRSAPLLFLFLGICTSKNTISLKQKQRLINNSKNIVPSHVIPPSQLSTDTEFKTKSTTDFSKFTCRLQLIACATMYGSNYVCTKSLQSTLSAQLVTLIRFALAALFYVPGLLKSKFNKRAVMRGVEIGLFCSIGYISQAVSLTHSPASKTAFMCGLGVLFVPLLDYFFGKKGPIFLTSFIAPVLAFFGVISLECGSIEPPVLSDVLLLITPIAFALNFWRAEKHVRENPNDVHIITGSSLVTICGISAVWGLVTGGLPLTAEARSAIWNLLRGRWGLLASLTYLGACVTAWASTMEQNALKTMSAAETTLIYTLEPLTGAAFAGLILKEHLGLNTIAGACFIVTACAFSALEPLLHTRQQTVEAFWQIEAIYRTSFLKNAEQNDIHAQSQHNGHQLNRDNKDCFATEMTGSLHYVMEDFSEEKRLRKHTTKEHGSIRGKTSSKTESKLNPTKILSKFMNIWLIIGRGRQNRKYIMAKNSSEINDFRQRTYLTTVIAFKLNRVCGSGNSCFEFNENCFIT